MAIEYKFVFYPTWTPQERETSCKSLELLTNNEGWRIITAIDAGHYDTKFLLMREKPDNTPYRG